MTTQMNFGPEWMRCGEIVPKLSSQQLADSNSDEYKYSKEYMLSLYKTTVDIPKGIQHHQYAVTAEGQRPLSLLEKEYKSDNMLSFKDFDKVNDQFINEINNEEIPLWSGEEKYNIGNFDSFGVYIDHSKQELEQEDSPAYSGLGHNFINNDTQRSYQWIYRDPIGIIQGPFSGLEMQGWYEAGFFERSLYVKREDVPYFEPLNDLIIKVNNSKTPFLAPWPANVGFGLKSTIAAPQSPFSNPPFVSSRVKETDSLWENDNPTTTINTSSSSWLSNQNDPLYQDTRQTTIRQRENDLDYQQLAMNQQMEQQYLAMLRQNQQHHLQLQQRMIQQQQQLLIQQQQQQQQIQPIFIGSQNYEQKIISPPVPQLPIQRGWSSVPGTPGIIDTIQNPWNNNAFSEPFVPSLPLESNSPSKKTLIENDDQLAFTLNSMSLSEPTELPVEHEQVNNESAWISKTTQKKTLREIQLEEVSLNKKIQSRSNTWSAVSSATKPMPSISNSTTLRNQQIKSNAWKTPVKQKRISTPSLPSMNTSSQHPTIKSEPKGPSEEFLKWCKLSLRELNTGVNVDDILQMLLSFPIDNSCLEIIHDIIYTNSKSMDGRRFANDFMTRRKADLEGKLNVTLPKTNLVSSEFKVVTTKKGKKKQH